jgi:hypothetical protein
MQTSLQKNACSSVDIPRMKNNEAELESHVGKYAVAELNAKNMQRQYEGRGNTPPTLSEAEMCSIVEAGGGRYVGIMNEIPGKMETIVLFISRQTRSTLGLPSSRLTIQAVREQLAESDAAFNQASSK